MDINIDFAKENDIDSWLNLLNLVKDNFPGLDIKEYTIALKIAIKNKETIIASFDNKLIGALAFSRNNYELAFLAVDPAYRNNGIAKKLVLKFISLFPKDTELFVITYRENDPKSIPARNLYKSVGFKQAELLTVFDYPCQKMIYTVKA